MGLGSGTLFFFSALGAFNGVLLSSYFFFFAHKRKVPHFFLGGLLMALSLRVGKSVLFYFDQDLPKTYLQIGLSACFFIGPALYFFLKSSIHPVKSVPRHWKVILGALFLFILLGGIVMPYQQYPAVWNKFWVPFIYLEWGLFVMAAGWLLRRTLHKVLRLQTRAPAQDIWLASVFIINTLIFATYLWAFWGGFYLSAAITFSFALYVSVSVLFQRKNNEDLFGNVPRNAPKKVSPEDAQAWASCLQKLMAEKQLFKNPNLKLPDLAREINLTAAQLSQFLNDGLGKNFTLFVNEYRIAHACELLKTNTRLSIEGIGDEAGFNSKSTFFAAFKKIKGVTPAVYQQQFGK
jgi:AraC-like DNA-binding protein